MIRWSEEITELHEFFEDLFNGVVTSLDRVEVALAPDFTIVGPDGGESDRAATIAMLAAARNSRQLDMSTTAHRLLHCSEEMIVASYIEHHHVAEGDTRRLSTALFVPDSDAPNGVCWLRVHETWVDF